MRTQNYVILQMKMNIMKVKITDIVKNKSNIVLGTKDSACFDLKIREIFFDDKNKITCYLGIKTEIPKGYKAVLVPRSSFTHKGWIMQNSPGQIDSDYRGEWMVKFEAIPQPILFGLFSKYKKFPYKENERVVQFYFEKVLKVNFEKSNKLNKSDRNIGGFGSTGK